MQIDPEIVGCVGFIGAPEAHGFVADGTCFFVRVVEEAEAFTYAVTARHLVRPTKFGKEILPLDGIVHIRISRKDKPPKICETIRRDWICPSDKHLDISIYSVDFRVWNADDDLLLSSLSAWGGNSILATPEAMKTVGDVSIGDEVFVPSLFTGHPGERTNIPVVRIGTVAAAPIESVRFGAPTVPAYLIELRSLGGISGAPVFLHLEPTRPFRTMPVRQGNQKDGWIVPYRVIGMVLGAYSGKYASDFVEDPDDDALSIKVKDADFNAGISVVLPIQHVLDLINSEPVRAVRMETLQVLQSQVGNQPAS
jgi:hypothetical protein